MDIDIIGKCNDRTLLTYKQCIFKKGWNIPNLENRQMLLSFWVPVLKVVEVIP